MASLLLPETRNFDKAFWSLITKGSFIKGEVTVQSIQSIMNHYLSRLKVDLNTIKVIHVAGSKGKGSTCVQTEALLRTRGLRTGLFTSPHLIDVRERFRMNGTPIKKISFLQHFWYVWDVLHEEEEESSLPEILRNDPTYRSVPGFFRFMTCLAFHIFTSEKVDVAIIEVGIGGRLDATNVVKFPVVCGISLLDLDHTQILGNTLPQIAREKAGIMKPSVPCFTVRQHVSAYNVLVDKARHIKCELSTPVHLRTLNGIQANALSPGSDVVGTRVGNGGGSGGGGGGIRSGSNSNSNSNSKKSHSNSSSSNGSTIDEKDSSDTSTIDINSIKRDRSHSNTLKNQFQLGLAGLHQETNASLALSLSRCFLRTTLPLIYNNDSLGPRAPLTSLEIHALERCTWPGRGQTVTMEMLRDDVAHTLYGTRSSNNNKDVTLRVDGAHTPKSIESCLQWFMNVTESSNCRVLIFNCSHERNVGQLLQILNNGCNFDGVIFCPADVGRPSRQPLPTINEVAKNMGVKVDINVDVNRNETTKDDRAVSKWQTIMCKAWNQLRLQQLQEQNNNGRNEKKVRNKLSGGWAHVCDTIDDAMAMLRKNRDDIGSGLQQSPCQVLVTGSLYLVGGVLSRCGWDPDNGFD